MGERERGGGCVWRGMRIREKINYLEYDYGEIKEKEMEREREGVLGAT
jgi:hypothetical protein